jgi:hypothetical protein
MNTLQKIVTIPKKFETLYFPMLELNVNGMPRMEATQMHGRLERVLCFVKFI